MKTYNNIQTNRQLKVSGQLRQSISSLMIKEEDYIKVIYGLSKTYQCG